MIIKLLNESLFQQTEFSFHLKLHSKTTRIIKFLKMDFKLSQYQVQQTSFNNDFSRSFKSQLI